MMQSTIQQYKRKFSLPELFFAFAALPRAGFYLMRNRIGGHLDGKFIERIMLAVTEVNGCPVCSYAHTRMALKEGMSSEEISSLLSGDTTKVSPEESKAIFFAQHFADQMGMPDQEAYQAIVNEYGKLKARIILSAAQIIFAGNAYGIPYSALKSRLKGAPYKDSSIIYEMTMELAGLLFIPLSFLHAAVMWAFHQPNVRFLR
jgi:AhpD family alkylhydroperoxidase